MASQRNGASKADLELANQLAQYYADPLGHVMFSYPWGTDQSIRLVPLHKRYQGRFDSEFGPDEWACIFLDDLGEQIYKRGFNGRDPVEPILFSTASGHGIGKTVIVAWLIRFILDTRPYAKGTVTANTAEQLRTKTWAALGAWHARGVTNHWFEYTSGRGAMTYYRKGMKNDWFCTAQTSREENSEAFAGQHAANSTSFYIFDEASGVPDRIFEVREGGLTDGEPMAFDFGNGTRKSGRFFENTIGRFRHRYITRQIDSRDVYITNKELHKTWIEDYGIDSDFVKVRVLGQFPSAGSTQFIPSDIVEAAMERPTPNGGPLVLGVDVARFGEDDSVIYPRMGDDARSWPMRTFKGLRTTELVAKVVEYVEEFRLVGLKVDMIFVDATGVGGGVADQLVNLKYPVHEVHFGSRPSDQKTYRFLVDELWAKAKEHMQNRLALPRKNDPHAQDLKEQLTQREFGYTIVGNKINLISKTQMKADGLPSPDKADALVLTYAAEVNQNSTSPLGGQAGGTVLSEYDPLANI
jgi:hypothetical protein